MTPLLDFETLLIEKKLFFPHTCDHSVLDSLSLKAAKVSSRIIKTLNYLSF